MIPGRLQQRWGLGSLPFPSVELSEVGQRPSWPALRPVGAGAGTAAWPRSGDGHVLLTATPRAVFVLLQGNETNKQLGNMETMRATSSPVELHQASGFYLEETQLESPGQMVS